MNDGIEKISQTLHGSIWRCIHSVLMMKEIVNSNTDDNNNSSDITNSSSYCNITSSRTSNSRESRITETISPLSPVRIQ